MSRSPFAFLFALAVFTLASAFGHAPEASAQIAQVVDLATLSTDPGGTLHRTYGNTGTGTSGVPVAGGFNVDDDDDEWNDFAMASFTASPFGRDRAGVVYLILGDGTTTGLIDTGVSNPRVLAFAGEGDEEYSGSEIWIDDVTDDGIGDLLIARQNYDPGSRVGAGALSIVVGGPALTAHAAAGVTLDLGAPPADVTITTIVGGMECGRLGIWVRAGDITGDSVSDLVIGADQEQISTQPTRDHVGAVYVVRGGTHLATGAVFDLADFDAPVSPPLEGDIMRIFASASPSSHAHFGATVQIGDLDGDGVGEVLFSETLNRAGAALDPPGSTCNSDASGGTLDGTLHIAWDDNFTGDPWLTSQEFTMSAPPGTATRIDGNALASNFGEELLAGFDFDGNGNPDLFVGDIVGDQTGTRGSSGYGYVYYDAVDLAGLDFDMASPPGSLVFSLIQGARAGDLAGDTAAAGDFDGDGIDDLALASPHFDPPGRSTAGGFHILHGQPTAWPAFIDLLTPPPSEQVHIAEVWGAEGSGSPGAGDTLGYSAAAGFIDGDGRMDLITNEMVGDGLQPGSTDAGNIVVISGAVFVPEPDPGVLAFAGMVTLAILRRRRKAS